MNETCAWLIGEKVGAIFDVNVSKYLYAVSTILQPTFLATMSRKIENFPLLVSYSRMC